LEYFEKQGGQETEGMKRGEVPRRYF